MRPALESGRVGWVFRQLDLSAMQAAAAHLLGEHDFSSFRSSMCQSPTPVKRLRDKLLLSKMADEKALEKIHAAVVAEVDDAITFAEQSPLPPAEEAALNVYAEWREEQ